MLPSKKSGFLNLSVSTQQLLANRQNALRSTGPKSISGKERSALNSVKHGLGCHQSFDDHPLFPLFVNELTHAGFDSVQAREIASCTLYCELVLERKMSVLSQCKGPSGNYMPLENVSRLLAETMDPKVKTSKKEFTNVAKLIYKSLETESFAARHHIELADRHSKMMRYEVNAFSRLAKSIVKNNKTNPF